MEPNKLEKEFRKQLSSREIQPSEMAWEKLDAMLTEAQGKKPKRNFTWMYIAASLVGFLLVGTMYFNQKETVLENQETKVVLEKQGKTNTNKTILDTTDFKKEEKVLVENVVQQSVPISKKNQELNKNSIVANKIVNQKQIVEYSIINQNKEQESISSKANAIIVDELLARVDKSARLNNKVNPDLQIHVNANQLLEQIDNDLEPTFRQQVFTKVADNFKLVKDAFVNRNKEE